MNRQPAAVLIICLVTKQIEQLGVGQRDEEVESIVGVADDDKERGLAITELIQLQLIVGGQFAQLFDVKRREPGAAADEN